MHRKNRGTIMKTERYYVSENVTLTVEVKTGRLDIIARRKYGNITKTDFWYATRDTKSKKWDLNYCINGFCYNSAKLSERFASRADVIKHLSERTMRIYNKGLDEIPVEEIKATDDNEHEETIKFYHVRDTKTDHVENVFATSEESAKRLVFGRRDTTKSNLKVEPVTVNGKVLRTTVCSLDGYTGIKITCDNRTYYYRTRREGTNWVVYELQGGFDSYGLDDMNLYRSRKEAVASAEKQVQKRLQRIAESVPIARPVTNDLTEKELEYCINDISILKDIINSKYGYCDTDSVKHHKKHYYKMNSIGQWYELNRYNFMILWTSDIMFHVYLNDKCIGHGEICISKIGFMYDCEEYNGFVDCDVENVTTDTKRKKVRTRMLEYYADEITEAYKGEMIK